MNDRLMKRSGAFHVGPAIVHSRLQTPGNRPEHQEHIMTHFVFAVLVIAATSATLLSAGMAGV